VLTGVTARDLTGGCAFGSPAKRQCLQFRRSVLALGHAWCHLTFTLWLFNIAMENGPFIDGLPIKNGDFPWQTVSHNQMVVHRCVL
jgi:hypothetical protein